MDVFLEVSFEKNSESQVFFFFFFFGQSFLI